MIKVQPVETPAKFRNRLSYPSRRPQRRYDHAQIPSYHDPCSGKFLLENPTLIPNSPCGMTQFCLLTSQ